MGVISPQTASRLHRAMQAQGLPSAFMDSIEQCYLPLAEIIAQERQGNERAISISINGPQGSGKSTLTGFLECLLREEFGLRAASVSLDDFYHPRRDRLALARSQHPLFATRGVPGTHDTALAVETFDALLKPGDGRACPLPRFDKAADERLPAEHWPRFEAPVDVLLFEGWCNHCPPQREEELEQPLNELEQKEDPDGRWRRAVNRYLAAYGDSIFRPVDLLLYLRIPDFAKVHEWRGLQEQKLKQRLGPDAGMDDAQLRRFIQHYERLTRQGMKTLPERADLIIDLDRDHQAVGLVRRRS